MTKRLAEYIGADTSFARSINLRYDFLDVGQIERYVPTTKSAKVLNETLSSLLGSTADRSRVVSGPYGSGKSAFALFLSALLRKERRLERALEKPLARLRKFDPETWRLARAFQHKNQRFLVVVVSQDEEGLLLSLHKSVCRALSEHSSTRSEAKKLARALGPARRVHSPEDLNLGITNLLARLRKKWIAGVFFLCDEFGKFLERFALEPDTRSLFFLQTLCEFSNRLGSDSVNFLFLLHLP